MHILQPHETRNAAPLERMSNLLAEALKWKRRRWEAEKIMAGFWRNSGEPEHLDAEEDYYHAKAKHRTAIIDALNVRAGRRLDATLAKMREEA